MTHLRLTTPEWTARLTHTARGGGGMSQRRTVRFRYTIGQQVLWDHRPWRVAFRRYTERQLFAPIVEYGLAPAHRPGDVVWAYEADIVPLHTGEIRDYA